MARVEERFNKRAAALVDTMPPEVLQSAEFALGVRVRLLAQETFDHRSLSMHLTPDEALKFAEDLVRAARGRLAR